MIAVFGWSTSLSFAISTAAITIYSHLKQSGCSYEKKEKKQFIDAFTAFHFSLFFLAPAPASIIYKIHFMLHHQNCIRINNGRNRQHGERIAATESP